MEKLSIKSMSIDIDLTLPVTCVLGPTNSGKTYFLKKLINVIPNHDVYLDDILISEYDITYLKNNIVVVLDDDTFKCEYVAEELHYYLSKLGYRIDEITNKINELAKFFKISSLLSERIDLLTIEKRILIKILALLIIKPQIFGIDNLLGYLNENDKKNLLTFCVSNKITLINCTNNGEELLISDKVLLLNDMKTIFYGDKKELLNGNTILPYIGINLPFTAEMSQNLVLYGIINKVYLDEKKLVDKIWK
ncbi:hypothetical protein EGP95_01600 [bacterium]|nr:hypothetical protein [bacterium]